MMPLISGWILRRAALLIAILVMALGVRSISAAAETTGNQTKSFDIPAGDARQMLKLFATQAGSQIVFTVESVEGVTTNAVKGEMTPRAAIDSMLASTDLVVVADENTGAFAVRRKKGGSQEKNVQSESTHGLPAAGNVTKARDEPILLDVFTVNGSYAGSLEMAAQTKQDAAAIVEVLAPEDIGQLPEVSIADALARLTGLTSQRVNGRDQQITIRGFSPDFSIGSLDGVEQATTNDNRAIEFDQYPSELVGGVKVFKTGQADLVGGLAGTIDLETVSPLSAGSRVISVSAFYNWTSFGQITPGLKKAGESFSASYIDKFANGTEGIYLGYSHTENPYTQKEFISWGPDPSFGPGGNMTFGGFEDFGSNELLKRDSIMAVLESRPNDWIHSKIDVFYSKFDDDQVAGGFQTPVLYGAVQIQPGWTASNGLLTNYTITNVQPVLDEQINHWIDHDFSAIWNLDLGEKSSWPVHFQAGWSSATKNEEILSTYAGLGYADAATDADTWQITNEPGPTPPQIVAKVNYSNASLFTLTDPLGWGSYVLPATGQEGYISYDQERDILDSFKLVTKHDLDNSIFKDVEVGISYSDRFKQTYDDINGFLVNASGQPQAPLPSNLGTSNLSFVGNLHLIAWDAQSLYANGAYKYIPNNPAQYAGDFYKVWEDVTRPFVKFDLKGNLLGIPFSGNIGVMADLATQSSNGLSASYTNNLVYPVSGGTSYADLLPSLNLIFKPTKQDNIRFFAGRQEQRPRMYDMRAARDYSYNTALATSTTQSPWGGSSGNPNLHPWIADSVDLDLEHYFADGGGYVSLAFFEKKLVSYIYQQATLTNFAGYPYTGTAPVLTTGTTTQFVNGQGGNVSGMEATVQVTSDALTNRAVKGFGIVVNGLLVDSNIQPWGPTNPSAPLPNMSKKSANITLFYEAHGFSARISEHYQSETREYIYNYGIQPTSGYGTPGDGYSEEIPFHTVDAQLSYAFKSGTLNGLTIYLDGRNLNNAPLINYFNGDTRQLANWQKYGASYRTGVSYKF
jgi:iron complex outermembrane receptor protein